MAYATKLSAGILFSGGDAPGMNALLRAFVRLGHKRYHGLVFGIKDGYLGLVRASRRLASQRWSAARLQREIVGRAARDAIFDRSQDIILLDDPSVGGIIDRGGIVLGRRFGGMAPGLKAGQGTSLLELKDAVMFRKRRPANVGQ